MCTSCWNNFRNYRLSKELENYARIIGNKIEINVEDVLEWCLDSSDDKSFMTLPMKICYFG